MSNAHTQIITVESDEELEKYLAYLVESGTEHVVYADRCGNVGFLYPTGEYEVTWHDVSSNPYNIEGGVDGVEMLDIVDDELDHRYVSIDLDKMQKPALPRGCYPLVLMHTSPISGANSVITGVDL